jgi:hypothetical protein
MSRYDLFRRRIAPIAFFLAIALIVRDSCERGERTHTTVELQFGAASAQVRAVDVDVIAGGEVIATFRRAALPGLEIGPCRFELALEHPEGELRVDVDLGETHRRFTRRYHAVEGSTMLVAIPDETPAAGSPSSGATRP